MPLSVEKFCRESCSRNRCSFHCTIDLIESSWLPLNLSFDSCLTPRTSTCKWLRFDVLFHRQRFYIPHCLQTIPLTVNLRNFSCALFCPSDCLAEAHMMLHGETYRSINILTFFPVTSFMLFLFAYTTHGAKRAHYIRRHKWKTRKREVCGNYYAG